MFGEVPRILATLPRWAAIEIAWNRKYVDLFSPVASAILDPISVMNFLPNVPQDMFKDM